MTDDLPPDLAELDFDVIVPEDVVNLRELNDYELSCITTDTRAALLRTGQMLKPPDQRTEEGATLHSTFTACQIELHRRMAEKGQ